jgi:uncharacterized protein (TIGR00251 family)
MKEIRTRGDGRLGFRVRIQPSAPRSKLLGWNSAGELRILIAAPPVEGKANKKLVALLSKRLSVPKGDVRIETGERGRIKVLTVPPSAEQALLALPDV